MLNSVSTQNGQDHFFDAPQRDNTRLMAAIDTVNREVGRVHLAASGLNPTWAMRRATPFPGLYDQMGGSAQSAVIAVSRQSGFMLTICIHVK